MCSGAVGCLLLGCQTDESVNQPGLQSCQMLQTPSDLLAPWEQEAVVGMLCCGSLIQESSTIAGVVEPVLLITQHQQQFWNIFWIKKLYFFLSVYYSQLKLVKNGNQ